MKTLFLEVRELKVGEAVKNLFSYCAGIIVRLFTSDKKLVLQFTQKWLETRDCKHEDMKQTIYFLELSTHFVQLLNTIDEAIGPQGRFCVRQLERSRPEKIRFSVAENKEEIMGKLFSGEIKISGDTDSEKLASFFKGAFPDSKFIVTERRSGVSSQTPSQVMSGGDTDTPAGDAQDLINFMESNIAIIAALHAKVAQRSSIQPVVDEAFGVLMEDASVKTAVDALHSQLSGEGKLAENMGDKDEFRKAFLWNVAHAAVKNQARQIFADRSDENVGINFSNFLKSDDLAVRKIVFEGILKNEHLEESKDASADGFAQTPDSLLAAAFDAIGKATTNNPTPDSIRQEIMDTKMENIWISDEPQGEVQFWENFGGAWGDYKGTLLHFSSKEVVSEETAFELLRGKAAAAIPDTLAAPSELSAPAVPETLGDDGENVASRFAKTVQGTPFEELFSVPEDATEENVNKALKFMSNAYVTLQDKAKGIAKLKNPVKFGIVLDKSAIFTKEDANRLREIQKQKRTP
ncbi:MAG: hypothetical protein LBS68_02080 [Puniceicoccales bacterium]|jgi:hypothetical protein|nr:hypothetical protein [Puniceicoccales bacterium]